MGLAAIQTETSPTKFFRFSASTCDNLNQRTPSPVSATWFREKATTLMSDMVNWASTCVPTGLVAPNTPTVVRCSIPSLLNESRSFPEFGPGGSPACPSRNSLKNMFGPPHPSPRDQRGASYIAALYNRPSPRHLRRDKSNPPSPRAPPERLPHRAQQ